MELTYIFVAALIVCMILWAIDTAKYHCLQVHTSPSLGRGYRKYRDEFPTGEACFTNWWTIGPFTFRWFSSK